VLDELREGDARLHLRVRLHFDQPALLGPSLSHHAANVSGTAAGDKGAPKRHAQAGAWAREELPRCAAAFWHKLVEAGDPHGDDRGRTRCLHQQRATEWRRQRRVHGNEFFGGEREIRVISTEVT